MVLGSGPLARAEVSVVSRFGRVWCLLGLVVVVVAGIGGCDGPADPPSCRCSGAVPGGSLSVACGGTQCVGGVGYRCTDVNTAVSDPSACATPPDGGSITCPDPRACPSGCCSGSTCQPGTAVNMCGTGGAGCAACGVGESCSGGACFSTSTGCSVRNTGLDIEDTCAGEQICDCGASPFCEGTGTCVPAFGRIYRIGITRVQLPDRRPDGMCWDDPSCGAPDPYVLVSVGGSGVGMTTAGSDTFGVTWDPPAVFNASILAGTAVRLDVYDEDLTSDDGALACVFDPITAATLRSRSLSCSGALGELEAVIVYAP